MADTEQQVRRAYFNVVARNQDDHVKNIAFLMDRRGAWRLSPAFDIAYSYNPSGAWTGQHQMSLNGKRDGFDVDDLIAFAGVGGLKKTKARAILSDVSTAVRSWRRFAEDAGMAEADIDRIERTQRRQLFF
ncbi:MAG: type II toxin-antitoxin system HipA family toxin [Hyphomonas sp.]